MTKETLEAYKVAFNEHHVFLIEEISDRIYGKKPSQSEAQKILSTALLNYYAEFK